MKSVRRIALPGALLLVLGLVLGISFGTAVRDQDTLRQLEKLQDAFMIVHGHYVDEVRAADAVEYAIKGLLEELDPHSIYISADEIKEVREGIQGSFGGVGIWFEVVDDTARVIATVPDGPSEAAGVMAGDRIVGIGDTSAIGFTDRDIQKYLKGPIGTEVIMTVRRPGVQTPIDFDITRGNISLHTVESDYMLDEQTGYIRMSRFAVSSFDEFTKAVGRLKRAGMQRLVLDLRDNPGGVMEAAVRIVDEMLDDDKTIVYTKSRSGQFDVRHVSSNGGILVDEPIIVLVSPYSASASEIVAGALQDHDRALIVGQRTFGKGLVQQQFTLPDGSVLQMTVSRYYTPSGRLIQTPYTSGDAESYYEEKFASLREATYQPSEYMNHLPDSLKFATAHGRTVFGGGGVLPDFIVAPDTASTFWPVVRNRLDMMFVREWFGAREAEMRAQWTDREDEFATSFGIDEQMWDEFTSFVARKQAELVEEAEDPVPDETLITASHLADNKADLTQLLKARLARQMYGARASYPIYNQLDPTIQRAMQLWNRADDLAAYHHPSAR